MVDFGDTIFAYSFSCSLLAILIAQLQIFWYLLNHWC